MALKPKEAGEQASLIEQSDLAASNLSSDEQGYQAANGTNAYSKCGGALRAARENQGLSVQDVANRLRLGSKQIEAIEADNFAILPEPTIVRGFIRNYANQLKINAQPLLDAYIVIVPSATPYEMTVKPASAMKMSGHEKSKSGRYALVALALLLAVGVWLFYQHYIQKPSPTQPSANANRAGENAVGENATSAPAEVALPEAALPVAERAAYPAATDTQTTTALSLPAAGLTSSSLPSSPVGNQATLTVSANPVPAAANKAAALGVQLPSAQSGNPQLPNSQPTASTTLSVPVGTLAPTAEPPAAPMQKDMTKLEFNANQETWVNVLDTNGREVYSKIIFAGSRESIDVKPPVSVTVGNAGGTSMSMNGKDIDLAPHSRNNVAYIKLDK